ncbi:MAG: endonuclease/exonuclease/phosphatase family protein [Candidatus Moranbacteria bacterium]|nr:endonuclease/exonuclease/phosphatase family protein [Candidatus Moranbacteria bacterium]
MKQPLRWFIAVLLLVIAVFSAMWWVNSSRVSREDRVVRTRGSANGLSLVSWNACNFGKSKSAETLVSMARILRDDDIVALQEVSTGDAGAKAVAALSDELNRTGAKWDYIVSDPTIGPGTERFAFLFKTGKVWINRRDCRLAVSLRDVLDREPAIMTFHAGGKTFDVVSFHLCPDERRKGKDPRREVAAIGENPKELLGRPMILVGDFNLGHRDLDGVFERVLGGRHVIEGKTSLKAKSGKRGEYLNKEFDNVYVRGMSVVSSSIDDIVPSEGGLEKTRMLSDHLPVRVVFVP